MSSADDVVQRYVEDYSPQISSTIYCALYDYLADSPHGNFADLLREMRSEREIYQVHIINNQAIAKAVFSTLSTYQMALATGAKASDYSLHSNTASLLYILSVSFELMAMRRAQLDSWVLAYKNCFRSLMNLSLPQVDPFCEHVVRLSRYLTEYIQANGIRRAILIDLPVGNTLPTKLISEQLSLETRICNLRLSLSRNDAKKHGTTRTELLKDLITKSNPNEADIVVYIDEWYSGSNFHTVCRILDRLLKGKKTTFIPFAFLTLDSENHPRWRAFSQRHDSLLMGFELGDLPSRKILPPIATTLIQRGKYFFWSENDRIAGLRKMQVHGSLFSSIDSAIERLHQEKPLLIQVCAFEAYDLCSRTRKYSKAQATRLLIQGFNKCYSDYCSCRNSLKSVAEIECSGERFTDFVDVLTHTIQAYESTLVKRPALGAVALAVRYLRVFGEIDPTDRYYFKAQAPITTQLDGIGLIAHEETLRFLRARIDLLTSREIPPQS